MRKIEGERSIRTEIAVATNALIEVRTAADHIQLPAMARLADLLANTPGAVEALVNMQPKNGDQIRKS